MRNSGNVCTRFGIEVLHFAFSALTLLVGWHEKHPACKNWVLGCCCGRLCGVKCKWLAYSWCYCHPTISCFIKIQNGSAFLDRLTQIVLEKRSLNGCNSSWYRGSHWTSIMLPTIVIFTWSGFYHIFCNWFYNEHFMLFICLLLLIWFCMGYSLSIFNDWTTSY